MIHFYLFTPSRRSIRATLHSSIKSFGNLKRCAMFKCLGLSQLLPTPKLTLQIVGDNCANKSTYGQRCLASLNRLETLHFVTRRRVTELDCTLEKCVLHCLIFSWIIVFHGISVKMLKRWVHCHCFKLVYSSGTCSSSNIF